MKGETPMTSDLLMKRQEDLHDSLLAAIDHFQRGEDSPGLDSLLNSLEDLNNLMNLYECLGEPAIDPELFLPALREMYRCMQDRDVVGLTDLIEFSIYPAAESWLNGQSAQW